MGEKVKVNITMDEDVVKKAKELGLNISRISENAIKEYIKRLEHSKVVNIPNNVMKVLEETSKKTGKPITDLVKEALENQINKSTFDMLRERDCSQDAIREIEKWYL
ncbi:MAG: type II toxin-antitoxin system CcdA family antitoxin [Thermoproteota archaeon]|nr:type II toxin-antitoxin system CcdA family antitoxin [Thermoproteota archaeon]